MNKSAVALLAVCGALAAMPALAAEPEFGALAVKPADITKASQQQAPISLRLLPAPQISETRVVRLADGSTHIYCEDIPNPRYKQARQELKLRQEQQR